MRSIMSLGLTSEQAIELLTHRAVGLAQADTGVLDGIFDASDRPEGGDTIVWFNDFEKDTRYERWGSALQLVGSVSILSTVIAQFSSKAPQTYVSRPNADYQAQSIQHRHSGRPFTSYHSQLLRWHGDQRH